MKYMYYRTPNGNFGDDLNNWLWPKLFGEEKNDSILFFGIGSILSNELDITKNNDEKRKIVFGTGVRPTHNMFRVDDKWDLRFVRGPLSSNSIAQKPDYITDAAYALRLTDDIKNFIGVKKKYNVSFMPHISSIGLFDWEVICKDLGFNYISPFSEKGIEFTLSEIAASNQIISEAMHGAIVSDILRVPWKRFVLSTPYTEGGNVSEFKWTDWLYSLKLHGIENKYVKLYKRPKLSKKIKTITRNILNVEFFVKPVIRNEILDELSKSGAYYMSNDSIINEIDEKLSYQADELLKNYNG